MISNNPDNEARPQCTKTKAVYEEEQTKDDLLVDLNNNSVNTTEAPKPQWSRKSKFGPFETSFEEDDETPKEPDILKSQWDPFIEPFTNNLLDYFSIGDCVPAMNLSRTL
jgi:hypothetical protein